MSILPYIIFNVDEIRKMIIEYVRSLLIFKEFLLIFENNLLPELLLISKI